MYYLSPLRYPGSKGKVLNLILPYINQAKKYCTEYREPFIGGGSIFLNSPGWEEYWINDIDINISTFFLVVRDKPEILCKMINEVQPTIDNWNKIRYSNPTVDYEIAFRTLFLNRTNYSGILKARPIGGFKQKSEYAISCRWNPETLTKRIMFLSSKLKNVKITCQDFFFVISKPSNKRGFLVLDPPYYKKGNGLYNESMNHFDHERLRDLLATTQHLFLLTYDNCKEVRKLYSDIPNLYFWERSWKYTTSTVTSGQREYGEELFISNFEVPNLPLKMIENKKVI